MASKAQRLVTDVPPGDEIWARFGTALKDWREDVLGYEYRTELARASGVNLRLLQDFEKNYRPGTYTKFAFADAEKAYQVTLASMLAFLHREAAALARLPARGPGLAAVIEVPALPAAPIGDPAREQAARPYALAIWKRFLNLPRRITDPGAAHLGLSGDDAKIWNGSAGAMDLGDRVWLVADMAASRAARGGGTAPRAGANSA